MGTVPPTWHRELVVVRTDALPSDRQLADSLVDTPWDRVEIVGRDDLSDLVQTRRPDVVIAAARGFVVAAYLDLLFRTAGAQRPVIVSGLPGISLPAQLNGVRARGACDVLVLHAKAEVEQYTQLVEQLGGTHARVGLSTLPFLRDRLTHPHAQVRDSIVFAPQPSVPRTRRERMLVVHALVATAHAHPEHRVVIKVRAVGAEAQTHAEQFPYPQLLVEYCTERSLTIPENLVIESGPMAQHLERAVGFVTVSSTALLEAVALDVPVLALSDFGIRAGLINVALVDSGMLGSTAELSAEHFHQPNSAWLDEHYFHDASDNTWWTMVMELLVRRETSGLPPVVTRQRGVLPALRMGFYRHRSFLPQRITLSYRLQSVWWNAVQWGQRKLKRAREHKAFLTW